MTTDQAYEEFLGELRAEFGRRRLKQSTIAPAMGLKQQHLSNRLNGVTPFSVLDLLRLADAMGISPSAMLEWAPRGSNPQPTGLRAHVAARLGRIKPRRRHVIYAHPHNHPALSGRIHEPRTPAIYLEVA